MAQVIKLSVTLAPCKFNHSAALLAHNVDPKILGEFNDIDILFLPIAGGDILSVPQASKLAVKLGAKLIIPMHYNDATLKLFLKEEGDETLKPVDKLTIKRKEVSVLEGSIVVIKS